jgi:hypothetical protein
MEHHDPKPVVKNFLPHIRWLQVWGYPNDLDRFFCVVKHGTEQPQAVDMCLSDIVNTRLGVIQPEQDPYIEVDKPWSYYLNNCRLISAGSSFICAPLI